MVKIQFQDGVMTANGYVEIEGVRYTIVPAEYSGDTPLSAFILNKMQDNIEDAINNISFLDIQIVQTLPTEDISVKTLYLVSKTGQSGDIYDEYLYINNNWEYVGSTEVDLTNYYTKTEVDALIGSTGGETLPVGTEVDYDGTNVPVGWEEIDALEDITSQCTFVNCTYNTGKVLVDRNKKILYVQLSVNSTITNAWESLVIVPNDITPMGAFGTPAGTPLIGGNAWIYTSHHIQRDLNPGLVSLVGYVFIE